jgi:tagatose-1,6-bisphosphate aldolase non-catalytic subunit AgaZ/GatZ
MPLTVLLGDDAQRAAEILADHTALLETLTSKVARLETALSSSVAVPVTEVPTPAGSHVDLEELHHIVRAAWVLFAVTPLFSVFVVMLVLLLGR